MMAGETYTHGIDGPETKLTYLVINVNNLANNYFRRAEAELAKFQDDSYDSDISGAWSTKEMGEVRKNYELYLAIAQDIAALLR